MKGRSVFVTGAFGLLGTWLTRELLAREARVAVLRRDEVAHSPLVIEGLTEHVDVLTGDVTEPGTIERALAEYDVDTVFHLAAQAEVGTGNRSPVATYETNVRGTWVVLEACRRLEVEGVVVAASDKAYGAHDELPYREDFALRPRHPYEASKAAADLIARSYWHTYGLPVAVTRFANLYGGADLNFSRLVPESVAAALQGRAPIIRSDGTLERDYLYVEDAAAAYIAIAEHMQDGAAGEAFNAGTGTPVSVLEVVRAVARAAGVDLEPDVRGSGVPEGEIRRQYVDSSKLRELTGWEPRVDLEEGLRRTVAWYREHPEVLPVS